MAQPADGYTLVVGASGPDGGRSRRSTRKLPYHPTHDFLPLTMIASFPLILAGPVNDAIKSVKDLVAWGKANPDKSNYATSSPAFTITTELFKLKTGMPAQPIPYKSSNEMMLSIAGGNSLFSIADGPPTVPLVQGGKVRALAVTGSERSSELPDVPSMAEAGLSGGEYRAVERGVRRSAVRRPRSPTSSRPNCGASLADPGRARETQGDGGQSRRRPGARSSARISMPTSQVFGDVVKAANLKFEE